MGQETGVGKKRRVERERKKVKVARIKVDLLDWSHGLLNLGTGISL
ncbi:MAG: hypothetical protein GTO12_10420 [Proteobacteria bacterium]|nr:hypothetical protein [Pseudomonadota bacterium]